MGKSQIWVLAEANRQDITRTTVGLIAKARQLAAEKDMTVLAVLPGGTQEKADRLATLCPQVVWTQKQGLPALVRIVESHGEPEAMMAAANAAGLQWMPRLAVRLQGGYLSSCIDLWWEGDRLAARRPVYGGRVYQEAAFVGTPALVTVRPGSFSANAETLAQPGTAECIPRDQVDDPAVTEVSRQATTSGTRPSLSEAARVVAGGRGMGAAENFSLIEELATELDAAVGASRAVVDEGWRPHGEQVGKSGRTISPELYIACGISGAIHHVLGMNTSRLVVAINSDPDALIFENADYGLVGDAKELVPALTRALKK